MTFMKKHVNFVQASEARGRNGWFHPQEAVLYSDISGESKVEVWSAKTGRNAPVVLWLTHDDMLRLGEAMIAVARGALNGDLACVECGLVVAEGEDGSCQGHEYQLGMTS